MINREKPRLYIRFVNLLLIAIFLCLSVSSLPSIEEVRCLPENLVLSQSELNNIKLKNFGVSVEGENQAIVGGQTNAKLKFKLFNIFPVKTVNVAVEQERKAYLGGFPVGLSIKTTGVMVVSRMQIETCAGWVLPSTEVAKGDIIKEINRTPILYATDIIEVMKSLTKKDKMVEIKVLRCGNETKVASFPVIEELTGDYKLGLAVKDSVEGIGTVSYIKSDGTFGCLGHAINGNNNNGIIPCHDGQVYDCRLAGYNKGSRGKPGELKGSFINTQEPIGVIEKNNKFGVYGKLNKVRSSDVYEIGSRLSVKSGKAQILTTIEDSPVFYDIEIIKSVSQNSPGEKSMIIRVTDKKLLKTTGGILQGMSGSPIIQNGKLVGVVTHVLLNDPTKGYAVYLDWMFNN